MLFNSLPIIEAMQCVVIVFGIALAITIVLAWVHNRYFRKYASTDFDNDKRVCMKKRILKATYLLFLAATGYLLGNLALIFISYNIGISHGMAPDKDTQTYVLTLDEVMYFNKNSIKETNVNVDALDNSIIIYVRYDCSDCVMLHDDLLALESKDVIFLSSRSDVGKAVREKYDINLTEVPQGVYIDADGVATVINIMDSDGTMPTLNEHQTDILFGMRNHA